MGVAAMQVYVNGYKKWLLVPLCSIWSHKRTRKASVIWQCFSPEADENIIPKQELEDQEVLQGSMSEAWQSVVSFAFVHFGVQMSIISKYRDDCDNNN